MIEDLPTRLARLGGALRAHAAGTTLRDELDAARGLAHVDTTDRAEVRRALLVTLKIPRAHFATFDALFSIFWGEELAVPPRLTPRRALESRAPKRGPELRWNPETRRLETTRDEPADGEEPGYSSQARLRVKRFDRRDWSAAELAQMERLLALWARRLAARRSRRLIPSRGRGFVDLRASQRRALRTSGELLVLGRRARARDAPRLVFLCDTSGSMDAHARFLLLFVLSLRRVVRRAELFAFNTELTHLSPLLVPGKVRLTLDRLSERVHDWSGGTRIGESLAEFAGKYLDRVVDASTVVVILSDGLDRGEPALLTQSLRAIRRRAKKLVWLNPLLGDAGYEPSARGMQAALPFIDQFAAAHDLRSLERLLPLLA